jgi:hypothetical protein
MYQAFLLGVPNTPNKDMVDGLIAESKKALDEQTAAAQKLESQKLETEKKKAEEDRKAKEAEAVTATEHAKVQQAQIAADRERAKSYNNHPARKWMVFTSVLGLAAAGGGAYFGLQSRNAQTAFDKAQCGDSSVPRLQAQLDECNDNRDLGKRDALFSNAMIGAGGAVVLISALIYAIDPGNIEAPKERRVQVGVTPSTVQVVLEW